MSPRSAEAPDELIVQAARPLRKQIRRGR